MLESEREFAVFVGRFCPVHRGHQNVIEKMLALFTPLRCLVVVGSSNAKFSRRHFFSFEERLKFLKILFPALKLIGLADVGSYKRWLASLDRALESEGIDPQRVVFLGGSKEDIDFFVGAGRCVRIVNRYDGTNPVVSASEVRDCLFEGRYEELETLLDPKIKDLVVQIFETKQTQNTL